MVDEAESVNREALHHAERTRYAEVRHEPQGVCLGLSVQGDEVPKGVVHALRLRNFPVRVGLGAWTMSGNLLAS